MNRISFVVFTAGLVLISSFSSAIAADRFDTVPAVKGQRANGLVIRIVQYAGSTNGAITVDVKNPSAEPQEFTAKGLYFVPQGNANEAPQRLGAVGPFQVLSGGGGPRADHLTIAPGATERLALDVYCIDSHRASPGPATPFRVAKDRVPEPLMKAIDALAIGDILVSEIAPPPLTPALLQLREPSAQWVECHHYDGPHNVDSIQ